MLIGRIRARGSVPEDRGFRVACVRKRARPGGDVIDITDISAAGEAAFPQPRFSSFRTRSLGTALLCRCAWVGWLVGDFRGGEEANVRFAAALSWPCHWGAV
jgi:hypothetical protein